MEAWEAPARLKFRKSLDLGDFLSCTKVINCYRMILMITVKIDELR